MSDEETENPKLIPSWGYSAKDAKIFHLREGEPLPEGYYDSPAKVGKAKPQRAKSAAPDETHPEPPPPAPVKRPVGRPRGRPRGS